ncbi:MAG: hypothetical protein QOI20_1546 [Acidimicrobiaceae bacterium]|jgi:hypothetical protein|nr:hypothetical protein [Acidimicrobiaceae bacterium]
MEGSVLDNGVSEVDGEGDVYGLGEKAYDCPPYDILSPSQHPLAPVVGR